MVRLSVPFFWLSVVLDLPDSRLSIKLSSKVVATAWMVAVHGLAIVELISAIVAAAEDYGFAAAEITVKMAAIWLGATCLAVWATLSVVAESAVQVWILAPLRSFALLLALRMLEPKEGFRSAQAKTTRFLPSFHSRSGPLAQRRIPKKVLPFRQA